MKLSALLLSVNIAASLPIAFCQMAPAAEEGVADTGDWLKNNLATIKKGKTDLPTSRLKVSMPEKISSGDKSFDAYVARLKPMHKAAKLPSQRDLDMQLVSMTPRMAVDPNSQLMGNVSQAQYNDYPAPRAYRQPQSLANSVPRSLSAPDTTSFRESAVAMARQAISGVHHMGAAPSAKNIKSAKRGAGQSLQDRMDDWLGQPKGDEKMLGQAGASLVQMPVMPQQMSPKDADLERQINLPMGEMQPMQPQQSSAGPAPFPLNLVPEAQLKNFIRGGRGSGPSMNGMGSMGGLGHGSMHPSAPKAFFGSWHGNHGLPKAGFRSNLYGAHYAQQHNVVQMRPKNRYSKGPKAVAPRAVAKNAPVNFAARNVQASLPPQVASYGPYVSHFRAF